MHLKRVTSVKTRYGGVANCPNAVPERVALSLLALSLPLTCARAEDVILLDFIGRVMTCVILEALVNRCAGLLYVKQRAEHGLKV